MVTLHIILISLIMLNAVLKTVWHDIQKHQTKPIVSARKHNSKQRSPVRDAYVPGREWSWLHSYFLACTFYSSRSTEIRSQTAHAESWCSDLSSVHCTGMYALDVDVWCATTDALDVLRTNKETVNAKPSCSPLIVVSSKIVRNLSYALA